eukprot:SAG22_NODE_3709_length_1563_cov_1.665984_3_plen_81_part_00
MLCETAWKGTVLDGKTVEAQQKGSALVLTSSGFLTIGQYDGFFELGAVRMLTTAACDQPAPPDVSAAEPQGKAEKQKERQ